MGEGEGGMIWGNVIETCIISYKKRIASPGSIQENVNTRFLTFKAIVDVDNLTIF